MQEWKGGEPPTFTASFTHDEIVEVQFGEPTSLAVDKSGDIWVADSAHDHILQFNAGRVFEKQIGEEGSATGQFKGIGGVAFDSSGDLFAADTGNNRIQEYSSSHVWSTFGSSSGAYKLNSPIAIAIDSEGNIWVLNAAYGTPKEDQIVEFSHSTHEPIGHFGEKGTGKGQLDVASGLAFSGGHLYVSEFSPQRVQELSVQTGHLGEPLAEFDEGAEGRGKPQDPLSIATNPTTGDLYVSEYGNRVQQFSASGSYKASFGSTGSGSGQFSEPTGVAVSSSGTIFVADKHNLRIEEWGPRE